MLRETTETLNHRENLESGVDVIGDIAIVKFDSSRDMKVVGEKILDSFNNVKVVFGQEGGIEGEFRLRKLRHLAGEERSITLHKENGCQFRLDVERCFFSPRLSTERLRIAEMARDGERMLNMFAGVGAYSITVARRKAVHIDSCELSKTAYEFHVENNRLNKVSNRIRPINEDASRLPSILHDKYDRILMPHPSQSDKFLPVALLLSRENATIHYYRHVSSENFTDAKSALAEELREVVSRPYDVRIRKVREVGKRYLELAADITLA